MLRQFPGEFDRARLAFDITHNASAFDPVVRDAAKAVLLEALKPPEPEPPFELNAKTRALLENIVTQQNLSDLDPLVLRDVLSALGRAGCLRWPSGMQPAATAAEAASVAYYR